MILTMMQAVRGPESHVTWTDITGTGLVTSGTGLVTCYHVIMVTCYDGSIVLVT